MPPWSDGDGARHPGASDLFARAAGAGRAATLRRRFVLVNLVALNSLILLVLYLGGSQDRLVQQRGDSLRQAVTLLADGISAPPPNGMSERAQSDLDHLKHLRLDAGSAVWLFDRSGRVLAHRTGDGAEDTPRSAGSGTPILDGLDRLGDWLTDASRTTNHSGTVQEPQEVARVFVGPALAEGPVLRRGDSAPGPGFWAAAPVGPVTAPVAVLVLADAPDQLARLLRSERERALRIFLVAALISVGLSLVLARMIPTPQPDLAPAAKTAGDGLPDSRAQKAARNRMPDPAACPDEIERLSESVRGMIAALHQRIESNEQFAADVVHEIKNPLTSLLCAVDTMRTTTRADQRDRLLDVIENDVHRLDRLVSDISSASRLDSDLVKQEQVQFDLVEMLRNVGQYLEPQARSKKVTFITNFPEQPIVITGLEARLAQVFVNLITNAISFCEAGDAIRIWACRRAERVLVVVEDTGPGIPANTFDKIFERFYSNRPDRDFGNHSGLGLAISKQIVEAHDGVIWAENIRPTEADSTSDPLGARFVVGLSCRR